MLSAGAGPGALGAGLAAVLSALCCTGPLAYSLLGPGGVLAAAQLAPARPYLLAAAAVCLVTGFALAYRPGSTSSLRTRRVTRAVLWAAALVTAAGAIAPWVML
ncbi:MAG: hypothetical protein ABJB47_20415 [Actinomycetota bacterium]